MKTVYFVLSFSVILVFSSCFPIGSGVRDGGLSISFHRNIGLSMNPISSKYDNQKILSEYVDEFDFTPFLDKGEVEIESGIDYMLSTDTDSNFIERLFFTGTDILVRKCVSPTEFVKDPNGYCLVYTDEGLLKSKGNYDYGYKIGKWLDYYKNGNIKSEGKFIEDNMEGEWKTYFKEGSLRKITTYTFGNKEGLKTIYDTLGNIKAELLFKNDSLFEIRSGSYDENIKYSDKLGYQFKPDVMPVFPGCEDQKDKMTEKEYLICYQKKMLVFIYKNLKYPESAIEMGIQGTTLVQFIINENGEVTDVDCIRGVSKGLKKASIDVIKKMPRWYPGTYNNKPVKTLYTLPLKFKLEG